MSRILAVIICSLVISAAAASAEVPVSPDQITLSFAPIVKRVVPAVVNIYTQHTEKVQAQISPFMADPLFSQFLGNQGFGGMPRERVVRSLGSGVIVGENGTIVTSYHVVKGSEQITVVLSDKREFKGVVEKIDENSDLAVLKVDTEGAHLPTLELRDSDTLEVGDLVLAVGNPFGVGQTVTSGIISALARAQSDISDYQFFIQTDAAINPGNSGGALVDMKGRLIGINTAIYSRTGGYQGIGFAIPANMVHAVLNGKANKAGSLIRPWFGVAVQPVTHEIADAQGLSGIKGVLVQQVAPDSPADKAGIKPGDIILTIGGSEVDDPQSLNFRIMTTGIGNSTNVAIWRSGKEIVLSIAFVTPPEKEKLKTYTLSGNSPFNGAKLAMLTPEIAQQLHLNSTEPRVVVVEGNTNNGMLSVETGDVIIAINGKQVHSVEDIEKNLAVKTPRLQISLVRGGTLLNMEVTR